MEGCLRCGPANLRNCVRQSGYCMFVTYKRDWMGWLQVKRLLWLWTSTVDLLKIRWCWLCERITCSAGRVSGCLVLAVLRQHWRYLFLDAMFAGVVSIRLEIGTRFLGCNRALQAHMFVYFRSVRTGTLSMFVQLDRGGARPLFIQNVALLLASRDVPRIWVWNEVDTKLRNTSFGWQSAVRTVGCCYFEARTSWYSSYAIQRLQRLQFVVNAPQYYNVRMWDGDGDGSLSMVSMERSWGLRAA